MNFFQKFMYGRYGADQMGLGLLVLYLLLSLLSSLFKSSLLKLLAVACIVYAFWRMLSHDLENRRKENDRFMELIRPVLHKYNAAKCRRSDKDHCYFKCPNCGQQLRVPKGKGKISITCRSCGASFEEKT